MPPKRVATGGSRERPSAIFCTTVSLNRASRLSRTYRATELRVIRGSRLLSRFPVLTRDTTKNRVSDDLSVKAAPLQGADRNGPSPAPSFSPYLLSGAS